MTGVIGTSAALSVLFNGARFNDSTWIQHGEYWVYALSKLKPSYKDFPDVNMIVLCENLTTGNKAMLLSEDQLGDILPQINRYFHARSKEPNYAVILTSEVNRQIQEIQTIVYGLSQRPLLHQLYKCNRFVPYTKDSNLKAVLEEINRQPRQGLDSQSGGKGFEFNMVAIAVIVVLCGIIIYLCMPKPTNCNAENATIEGLRHNLAQKTEQFDTIKQQFDHTTQQLHEKIQQLEGTTKRLKETTQQLTDKGTELQVANQQIADYEDIAAQFNRVNAKQMVRNKDKKGE